MSDDPREVSPEDVGRADNQEGAESNNSKLIQVSQTHFSGPLPPPTVFEHYEKVLPGAAERIMAMTENEQAHRHKCEGKLTTSLVSQHERGQRFALIIGVGAILLAAWLAWLGFPGWAMTTTFAAIATLVGAFIYRKASKSPVSEGTADESENPHHP